jgi:hypothetical protein
MVARRLLACLIVVLLACPAFSSPGVVGTAANSQGARVRGVELVPGTTIFSGDTIDVGEQGRARITLAGGGMMRLDANTQIRLTRTAEKIEFELTMGRIAFRLPGQPVQARLADATIASANGQEAAGIIAMLSPTKGIIASEKGELLVTTATNAKSVTLREGEGVEVTVPPPQKGGAATGTGMSRAGAIVLGSVVAGIITAAAIAWSRGEQKPSDAQRKNAVSPFRFP